MLDGHGDDLHLYGGKIKYNFSSNVYHEGCQIALQKHLSEQVKSVQNYPSPAAQELNKLAAKRYQISENQFLFTNGATEAFYLIAQYFSNKKAAILAPTFSEYADACNIYGVDYELLDRNHRSFSGYELVFICNPNNPDGSVISKKEIENLLSSYPSINFVIDEAYIEFTTAVQSVISLVDSYPNLIVVRSLTKSFAIPGLRLGYLVADSAIISSLLALKMPWSVNALAISAAEEIFKNYDNWLPNIDQLLEDKSLFAEQLDGIENINVMPSDTTYFLIKVLKGTATELKEYLAKECEILVRDATNFNRLNGEYIRVSTQGEKVNSQLIKALKAWS